MHSEVLNKHVDCLIMTAQYLQANLMSAEADKRYSYSKSSSMDFS